MAKLRDAERESAWPPDLALYDLERHGTRAAWHLQRAYAAKLYFSEPKSVALEEIRASMRRPARGGVVLLGPPQPHD